MKFHQLNLTDKKVESIPSLFQDIIERLAASQVMTVKPDACIVDFFNEVASSSPPFFFVGVVRWGVYWCQICLHN